MGTRPPPPPFKQKAKICVRMCVSADMSDYMRVPPRLCVHSVHVSFVEGSQSHEASPPPPTPPHIHTHSQFNSPLILIISDPKPLLLTSSYTQYLLHKRTTHTLLCAPCALSISSRQRRLAFRQRLRHKGEGSPLICCCLRQPTITLTFSLRCLSNGLYNKDLSSMPVKYKSMFHMFFFSHSYLEAQIVSYAIHFLC